MSSIILSCVCRHRFQDSEYGSGQRLHNIATKGYQGRAGARCTVCGKVRLASGVEPQVIKNETQV